MLVFANRFRILLLSLVLLGACAALISPYSEEAYRNATSLKARSLALIAQSDEPYPAHSDQADQLMVDVDTAYEYVKGRTGNEVSVQQWAVIRDPAGGLLGEFIPRWQQAGKISAALSAESAILIARGFDTIICVEASKRAATNCKGQ